jgi:hypothetical protein
METPEAALMKGLWWANLVTFAVLSAGAFVWAGWHSALSVVVGGAIALVNYRLLQRTVCRAFLPREKDGVLRKVLAKYYLRFLATAVLLFFLVRQGAVEPLGLLVGLSVVVVTIIAWGLRQALRLRKEAF